MRCELGQCFNCGTQIIDFSKKGRKRILENYCDHYLEINETSIMRIGVCQSCKQLLVAGKKVKETADAILENHKAYWKDDPHAPKGFEDYLVTDANTNEEKHLLKKQEKDFLEETKLNQQKQEYLNSLKEK